METAGQRDRRTIAILAGVGMLTSLQFTLIVPALPEVPVALGVTTNDSAWVITITLLAATVGTPIAARMADMYGRRRLLMVCLGVLIVGSMIAAVGMTFQTVLIGRAGQGLATAIVPIGISLMRELLSRERATMGTALMSATLGIGSALGLPLSGILVSVGGLAVLFWFSAIVGIGFFVLIAVFIPASTVRTGGRFDVVGAALLTVALTAALLVISKGLVWGWASPLVLTLVGVGVVALGIWIPQQLTNRNPVVDLRTSFRRQVLQVNIASFFTSVGMFANHLLTMHEARAPAGTGTGLALPAISAGLILLPSALVLVVLSPIVGRMLGRIGGRLPLTIGAATMGVGFLFRLVVHEGVMAAAVGAVIVGIGTAFAFAAVPTLIMDAVPISEMAAANGVNGLIRSMSGAVTSAAFALLVVAAPWPEDPQFISADGMRTAFIVVGICGGIGALLAATLPRSVPERSS